ncbi:hypothetical protein COCCADRAFT_92130 [Bipolaris zeicola 26-R-13]|uniref:Uncharacterized protein n=1 Tax=Cochliobolus carbonum (strain 26-R-13) TaxID=930089 RepID=W6YH38_COCC2|nr:uncharacterized protein COCCADRAFT_92130 [Bipolaris zeicola 26-R-13]EUC34899.1 hypothetical protein COCCADRAFT_92130 [Bipolaris zeicola 26-R-13]
MSNRLVRAQDAREQNSNTRDIPLTPIPMTTLRKTIHRVHTNLPFTQSTPSGNLYPPLASSLAHKRDP